MVAPSHRCAFVVVAAALSCVACDTPSAPRALSASRVAPAPAYVDASVAPSSSPPHDSASSSATATPHRPIAVRILVTRWNGALAADETGPWELSSAPNVVRNLNSAMRDVGLAFTLDKALPLDVSDARFAEIPPTQGAAGESIAHYVAMGAVSNEMLTVVIVRLNTTTWVQGWGNQDQPLRTAGAWPVILASTRVARSKDAHWIAHEFGHVVGFYDTTFYDSSSRANQPYTRCGLLLASTTFPLESAPLGAKQNFMSYNVDLRRSFLSAGYEIMYRQILDCWLRASGD